jgi:Protein of unknown function (DUF3567)
MQQTFLRKHSLMQMLYDSDSFVVVHLQAEAQAGSIAQDAVQVAMRGISLEADGQAMASSEASPYRLARHGFEIVDKRSGKEVYLDGSWAELFQQQIVAWQVKTPTQDEVEETLERYAQLAQNPVVLH